MRIHSLLSPKCHVAESPKGGFGVFAIDSFNAGELVAVWGGKVYSADEINMLSRSIPHFSTHPISLCDGYYLGSAELFEFDDAEYFNHSCEPNVGVKGQVLLVARRSIKIDEELTFDYETTEIAMDHPFTCKCRSQQCRGWIDGNGWKDPSFVDRNRGYLSWYIEELLRQGSSSDS